MNDVIGRHRPGSHHHERFLFRWGELAYLASTDGDRPPLRGRVTATSHRGPDLGLPMAPRYRR